ncbi:anthrone oxygenase family protein [Streptomyces sp. NPDC058294]|uniref:anthrone oxygenase family protein n=1 Tax=Streptomyces sp. NPDC058294 TaxID=3346430 RepID=UPI0036EE24ED
MEQGVVDRRVVLGEVEVGAGEGGDPLARAVCSGGRGTHRCGQLGGAFQGDGADDLALAAEVAVEDGLAVFDARLLMLSVVMSVLLLVPINNRNKTWTPENRPADWKEQLHRWNRYHYIRVVVIVAAFTLLVAALA